MSQSQKELISVIVPIYNTSAFLEKCINSLINQSYSNIEILLVNDGSPDNSLDICNDYAKKDSRIKVINKENTGVSDSRNVGIKQSTGDFIMFVDSDDYIENDYINQMYNFLKSNSYDLVISGMTFITEKNHLIKKEQYLENSQTIVFEEIKSDVISTPYFSSACKALYSSSLIKNQILFRSDLSYGEDLFFMFECMKKSTKLGYYACALYYYCINNNNGSKRDIEKIRKYLKDNLEIFTYFSQYVNEDLINQIILKKVNLTIKKVIEINGMNYKTFRKSVTDINNILNEYKLEIKNIKMNKVKNTSIDKILIKAICFNMWHMYYFMYSFICFIKKFR